MQTILKKCGPDFLAATVEILAQQAGAAAPSAITQVAQLDPSFRYHVVAHIALKAGPKSGYMRIFFPANYLQEMYQAATGEVQTGVSEEAEELALEFLNMIYGRAKAKANQKTGLVFEKAFPQFVSPSDLAKGGQAISLFRLDSGLGPSYVQFGLQAESERKSA